MENILDRLYITLLYIAFAIVSGFFGISIVLAFMGVKI